MTGRSSPLIAHIVFWILLVVGIWLHQLHGRRLRVVLLLWLAGGIGLSFLPNGGAIFAAYVAVLDIALVLMIFKGDVML